VAKKARDKDPVLEILVGTGGRQSQRSKIYMFMLEGLRLSPGLLLLY